MDYANRKRPPKRTPPKKSSKQTKKPAVSWSVVALALLLVGGLAWFLFSISGKSQQSLSDQPAATAPADSATPQATIEPLPEQPQEPYQYFDELENREVIVDVPEREVGPPKLMQCGSFRRQGDAEELRAMIAMIGLEAQVRATQGSNGMWYRVILGPYATKREAEADRHKLQRGKITGCVIWNWD